MNNLNRWFLTSWDGIRRHNKRGQPNQEVPTIQSYSKLVYF